MKNQELMLALFIVFGVVLVTGLIAIPVIEAEARCNHTSGEETPIISYDRM
jgi:hypothetical protein